MQLYNLQYSEVFASRFCNDNFNFLHKLEFLTLDFDRSHLQVILSRVITTRYFSSDASSFCVIIKSIVYVKSSELINNTPIEDLREKLRIAFRLSSRTFLFPVRTRRHSSEINLKIKNIYKKLEDICILTNLVAIHTQHHILYHQIGKIALETVAIRPQ